jgi:hypothetical protein
MQNFTLKPLTKIKGIQAASGIIYAQENLFLISDGSDFLYQYDLSKKVLLKFPLVKNSQENKDKKSKLDLESITQNGNQLIMLGSGSTKNRERMFTLNLENDQLQEQNLSKLFTKLKKISNLTNEQFNIEGAIYAHQTMLLFQRGNAGNNTNGIFLIPNNPEDTIQFVPIILPTLDHVETSFTDAVLVEETIYFLACAENSQSTYEDGEILGTILGKMHAKTFEIENVLLISENQKMEGLSVKEKSGNAITFLLCEDDDTDKDETTIYELKIKI